MTGIEAITAQNGWAMASVGATIVLSGLAILAFIISQLHKFVELLERKPEAEAIIAAPVPNKVSLPPTSPSLCSTNPEATFELYLPLIEELEEQFQLADLYTLAEKYHLPHPHLSIRCLRTSGKIKALGDGMFQCVM